MILEGNVSVKAALLAKRRTVSCVLIDQDKKDKDTHYIERIAKEAGVPVQHRRRAQLDALATGRTHGGVLADVEARRPDALEDCLSSDDPFLVLLEGVEDPYNLGYVIRSLHCAGCNGLILRPRNWENAESVILKASAGAYEYMPIVQMDPKEAVLACKRRDLHVFAAMRKDAISYLDADYRYPTLICIGGEMRGLSSGVLSACDTNIFVPYANDFRNALNAAGAAAVLGFEVFRQRSR